MTKVEAKKNAPLPRTIIVGSGAHMVAPLVRDAHRAQTPRRSSPGVTSLHSSVRVSCGDRASRVSSGVGVVMCVPGTGMCHRPY